VAKPPTIPGPCRGGRRHVPRIDVYRRERRWDRKRDRWMLVRVIVWRCNDCGKRATTEEVDT
jgi:hypothetical protein